MTNPHSTVPETPEAPPSLAALLGRPEIMSADCPSRDVLNHITSRWGVLLLVVLMGGMHRFSELHRKIGGVSEKMLAQTLRTLEADGLVHRRSRQTAQPHVEYTLTPLGLEAGGLVEALADWIERSLPRIMAARPGQLEHPLMDEVKAAIDAPGGDQVQRIEPIASKSPETRGMRQFDSTGNL